jgi:hypothetical protein
MLSFNFVFGAHIAQIGWQTSTDGVEVMDSTLKPLKTVLEGNSEIGPTLSPGLA